LGAVVIAGDGYAQPVVYFGLYRKDRKENEAMVSGTA
jgi:hypothetical protein